MKKYAKLVSLVLAIAMVFALGLTACSKPAEPSDSTQPSDSAAPSDSTEPSETTEGGGENLTLWTWKIGYQGGFEEVAKLANVNLTIDPLGVDAEYQNKVKAAANSKTLPDIVHWWGSTADDLSQSLVDMSTQEPFNTEEFKSRFYANAFDPVTVTKEQVAIWAESKDASEVTKSQKEGQYWFVPLDTGGPYTIFANKKLLEGANVSTEIPKTWEEMVANMEAYKKATGGSGLACSLQIPNLWRGWCWTALELMYNGPEGYAEVCDPFMDFDLLTDRHLATVEVVEELTEKELWVPGSLSLTIDEGDQTFAAEKACYLLGGSYTAATLQAMGMNMDDVFSFPIPALEGSKITEWTVTPGTLTGLGVSLNSEQKDAAFRYIETMSTVDGALAFGNNGYSIPATLLGDRVSELTPVLSMIMESYVTDGSDPLSQFNTNYPQLKPIAGGAWMTRFENGMQKIMMGEGTAEDALKDCMASKKEEVAAGNIVKLEGYEDQFKK